MTTYAVVSSHGHYLPQKILTNHDLATMVETDDTWIKERTGISQRHIAAEGECTSDLAAHALTQALDNASLSPRDIDIILVATATPDKTFPSTSTLVQSKTGCSKAAAMDINAACSGFVYGMHLANALIRTGTAKTIAVIGAETMSRVVDWQDRRTCILFGDGAGAVILRAESSSSATPRGILATEIYSDGTLADILLTDGGVSSSKTAGVLSMEGQEVFRHAVSKMTATSLHALSQAGLQASDIDWVVPHQANQRILSSVMKKVGVSEQALISTVAQHANTSAASIPLALSVSATEGKIKHENIVICPALGAGLTWGTCIIRW
jgi:3-oxoacyl-[acyl-carrier-protein] synthase III